MNDRRHLKLVAAALVVAAFALAPASAYGQVLQGVSMDGSKAFVATNEPLTVTDQNPNFDLYERSGGNTTLLSTGPFGIRGASDTEIGFRAASQDGSRVVFITKDQLVAEDTDPAFDLYLRSGGTTQLISDSPTAGNADVIVTTTRGGVSADGRTIAFQTAERLVPEDTDSSDDVYVGGAGSEHVELASIGPDGKGNRAGYRAVLQGITPDGSQVLFSTAEDLGTDYLYGNNDTDGFIDLYEHAVGTDLGIFTRLVSTGPTDNNESCDAIFAQHARTAGSRILFESRASLVDDDDDGGKSDVYERHVNGVTTMVTDSASDGPYDVTFAGASADGSHVLFRTKEQFDPVHDTDASIDLYERSGSVTTLVSTGPDGGNGAFDVSPTVAPSEDGSHVFFFTKEKLVTDDEDGSLDMYERSGGQTNLVSSGPSGDDGPFDVAIAGIAADGSRAFFATYEALVPADMDSSVDVYQRTTISDGTTSLVTTGPMGGNGAFDVVFGLPSADGSRFFFETAEPLVAEDTDAATDVYERFATTTRLVTVRGDSDGDGVLDFEDNCSFGSNPGQTDTDEDGSGDACDPDADADGVKNSEDNCPAAANPGQTNSDSDQAGGDACDADDDNDGVPDSEDAFPLDPTLPKPPDSDSDGLADGSDACPSQSDAAAQRNPRTGCPADPSGGGGEKPPSDGDGDGLADSVDACPTQSDAIAPRSPRTGCPADAPGIGPVATAGDDVLAGTAAGETLCGLLGNDTIGGGGGNDTLFGDACNDKTKVFAAQAGTDGNDKLSGDDGDDTLYGAGGKDTLKGGKGRDKLFGGDDNDTLSGDDGKDSLDGGRGNDKLSGGKDLNTIKGGAGNDSINARNGKKDTVDCGAGKRDKATVDKSDKIKGCEKVKRAKK